MSTAADQPATHWVLRALAGLHVQVDELAAAALWSLSTAESAQALRSVTALAARISELQLRVALQADTAGVGEEVGATSTAAWWAVETRQPRSQARALMHLARALNTRRERVRTALAEGRIGLEQARVIVQAVEDLPDDLPQEATTAAEAELVRLAADHDPRELRILGRRILDVVEPDAGQAHEAGLLAAEEEAARAGMRFTMTDDGHGRVHGRFTLPSLTGAMLRKALLALAAPGHLRAEGRPVDLARPTARRLGEAFAAFVERYPADRLPHAGGLAATAVVTIPLATLRGDLQAAALDTGELLSPAQARALCCEAGIYPAVLGGGSQLLDLGRKARFHHEPQRIAIGLRDGGCSVEDCDAPPGICHVHHDGAWATGGRTDVASGRLLCPPHHRKVHDPAYAITPGSGTKIRLNRRQ